MTADAAPECPPGQDLPDSEPPSLTQAARQWATTLLELLGSLADLAAIEARLAGFSLALMFTCAVALAIFAATAWVTIATALLLVLQTGFSTLVGTLFGVCAASALAGLICYLYIRFSSANLAFPATREALFFGAQAFANGRPLDKE